MPPARIWSNAQQLYRHDSRRLVKSREYRDTTDFYCTVGSFSHLALCPLTTDCALFIVLSGEQGMLDVNEYYFLVVLCFLQVVMLWRGAEDGSRRGEGPMTKTAAPSPDTLTPSRRARPAGTQTSDLDLRPTIKLLLILYDSALASPSLHFLRTSSSLPQCRGAHPIPRPSVRPKTSRLSRAWSSSRRTRAAPTARGTSTRDGPAGIWESSSASDAPVSTEAWEPTLVGSSRSTWIRGRTSSCRACCGGATPGQTSTGRQS